VVVSDAKTARWGTIVIEYTSTTWTDWEASDVPLPEPRYRWAEVSADPVLASMRAVVDGFDGLETERAK
jgi:hypothetical protein